MPNDYTVVMAVSRLKRRVLSLGLASMLATGAAWGETIVPAGTYDSDTWTAAGSPYVFSGRLYYTSLTIDAGTHVIAQSSDVTTIDVETLVVEGTSAHPVVLEAEQPDPGAWGGIIGDTVRVSHAIVRHTSLGLLVSGSGAVRDSRFEDSGNGIYANGNVIVDACDFVNNSIGILVPQDPAELVVTNSLFLDYSNLGIIGWHSCTDLQGAGLSKRRTRDR